MRPWAINTDSIGGASRLACKLFVGLAVVFALSFGTQAQAPQNVNVSLESSNYLLGPGDVLKVLVLKQDILTQDGVRISNDGTIRLPMLDEPIRASCLTEGELSTQIEERYRKYILNPQVYVSIREYNSSGVAVIGAVNSPGRFQLQRPVRLLEILTFVNGPSVNAGKELQILRSSGFAGCLGRLRGSDFARFR